jgi:AcrR family transcriptional regulator
VRQRRVIGRSRSSGAFIARTEREQIVLAFAELVMARGYSAVTLADVAWATGVDTATVKRYFATTEACAIAASEVATEQLLSASGCALMSTPGDCPVAARAALAAMLRTFAGMRPFVHLAVVEYGRIGGEAVAARHRAMDQAAAFLGPGFAAATEPTPRRETLSRLIVGGIYELVGRYYLEGRLEQLPEALPAVAYFTVAPFFGVEEAHRVASLQSVS